MASRKNNKTNTTNNSNNIVSTSSACVIVNGTVIEGDFRSTTDTRLDGVIIGNVNCKARIIMGQSSKIEGNIHTQQASIAGEFMGEMEVKETLSLKPTAKLNGKINAGKLEVEEGAMLNGDIKIGKFENGKTE